MTAKMGRTEILELCKTMGLDIEQLRKDPTKQQLRLHALNQYMTWIAKTDGGT